MTIDEVCLSEALYIRNRSADDRLDYLRRAGRLGALARYRTYGNPGTLEGRRKAGRLLVEWIRNNPDLARQLMDTDGSSFIHRYRVNGKEYRYPKLAFCSASDQLLESSFRLLSELGFHPRLAYGSHQVFIDRRNEFLRFYRVIGSRHERRRFIANEFV